MGIQEWIRSILLVVLCCPLISAADGKQSREAPLPEGAIARLGRPVRHFPVKYLAFSPDGKLLASSAELGKIFVWRVADGELVSEFDSPHRKGMAFSADGTSIIVVLDNQGGLLPHNWKDGQAGERLQPKMAFVAISCGGECAFSYRGADSPAVYHLSTGKIELFKEGIGVRSDLIQVTTGQPVWAISPKGDRAVVGEEYDSVRLAELRKASGRTLFRPVIVTTLAFSADGNTVAFLNESGAIQLVDLTTGKIAQVATKVGAVAFSPDGKSLAVVDAGGLRVIDRKTGEQRSVMGGQASPVSSVAILPDGRILIAGWGVRLWNRADGKQAPQVLHDPSLEFRRICLSPDGRCVAGAGYNGAISLWDLPSGKPHGKLPGRDQVLACVTFSADGTILAEGGNGGLIRIWDFASSTVIRQMKVPSQVNSLAFSPDGRFLAAGCSDNVSRVYAVDSSEERTILRGHRNQVQDVAFSSCGRWLASAGEDGDIRLWRTETWKETARLRRQIGWPSRVLFTPDGRTLVSSDSEGSIRLWEVATRQEYRRLTGHEKQVRGLALSRDGKILASGSDDSTVLLWKLGSDQQVVADLTEKELLSVWDGLGSEEVKRGREAVNALMARPTQAAEWLEKQLPANSHFPDEKGLRDLIAGLQANRFAARQRARKGLLDIGKPVEAHLLQALKEVTGIDERTRLEQLVSDLQRQEYSGSQLRFIRSLEVLESSGTETARRTIEKLVEGATEDERMELKTVLTRLPRLAPSNRK